MGFCDKRLDGELVQRQIESWRREFCCQLSEPTENPLERIHLRPAGEIRASLPASPRICSRSSLFYVMLRPVDGCCENCRVFALLAWCRTI
jgi:hypothetical protein